jgi:hypothetical protein
MHLAADAPIRWLLSISNREHEQKVPQNLPLHPTQFVTLEIETQTTNVTHAVAFSILGA